MMAPTPATRDGTPRHGAYGPPHPDRGIDVDNPDRDGQHRSRRVDQCGPALLLDGRLEPEEVLEVTEPGLPQSNSGDEQHANQHELRPEDKLLASVVLADLGQVVIVRRQHIAKARNPD